MEDHLEAQIRGLLEVEMERVIIQELGYWDLGEEAYPRFALDLIFTFHLLNTNTPISPTSFSAIKMYSFPAIRSKHLEG